MTSTNTGIRIDPAVLTEDESDASLRVDGPDVERIAAALGTASPRLARVTFDGREWPDDDALSAAVLADDSFATLNASYIGDVEADAAGAGVYIDTDGARPAELAATMARIVVEELERAGVTEAVVREG